jgi:hypothetical protein
MMFRWFGRVGQVNATRVAEFAAHLKDGRIMASRCTACGAQSFPPRADCELCMGSAFTFVEITGRGTLVTYTRIVAAPRGFEADAPYVIGVADLAEGGRALAWFGQTIPEEAIAIGMPLQLVPRVDDEREEIHVEYRLERVGTTWSRAAAEPALQGDQR